MRGRGRCLSLPSIISCRSTAPLGRCIGSGLSRCWARTGLGKSGDVYGSVEVDRAFAGCGALRIATEDLLTELRVRRPELVAKSSRDRYLRSALQHAEAARQLLNCHAGLAAKAGMAGAPGDSRRGDGGRAGVHRGPSAGAGRSWRSRTTATSSAGRSHSRCSGSGGGRAQVNETMGQRYAVIGSGVGVSEANGIGAPGSGFA